MSSPVNVHNPAMALPLDALVSNAAEAEKFVANRIAEGSDYIKIVADIPGPDQETLNAIVVHAHRHGKLVVSHAVNLAATRMAQTAGVDAITHAPVDGVMSDAEIQQMVRDRRISIPTLVMMKGVANNLNVDFEAPCKTVAAFHLAGVPILAGTDANHSPGASARVEHGESIHEELELLVGCGLSTTQALQAATRFTGQVFWLT